MSCPDILPLIELDYFRDRAKSDSYLVHTKLSTDQLAEFSTMGKEGGCDREKSEPSDSDLNPNLRREYFRKRRVVTWCAQYMLPKSATGDAAKLSSSDETNVLSTAESSLSDISSETDDSIKDAYSVPNECIIGRWPKPLKLQYSAKNWNLGKSFRKSALSRAIQLGSVLVRVVTWNLQASATPSIESLRKDLLSSNQHHIYVIGTEECENSIAASVVLQSKRNWEIRLQKTLGMKYSMVCSHTLNATHIVMFVHDSILPLVTHVQSAAVATGIPIGNRNARLGNKGGVGISFMLGSTSILLVNSHLAAHQDNVGERVEQYHEIKNQLLKLFWPNQVLSEESPMRLLDYYDHVIWSGDLNFRINATRDACDHMLSRQLHASLMANEQLTIERLKGTAFEEFEEGPLRFMPTYKYDRGCDVYDTSAKRRVPSWTDRILYSSRLKPKLLEYDCVQYLRHSDHRPVYATLLLPFSVSVRDHHNFKQNQLQPLEYTAGCTSEVCSVM